MRDEDDSLCCTARGILFSFRAECAGGFTLISLAGVLWFISRVAIINRFSNDPVNNMGNKIVERERYGNNGSFVEKRAAVRKGKGGYYFY